MAMRQTTLSIALVLVILSALVPARVAAEEPDTDAAAREALFNKTEAAQVSQRMHGDPRVARLLAACPADAFESERPFWRGLAAPQRPSERTCALHPADCYDLCVSWANGPACFELSFAYEHHSLDVPDGLDQLRLHALACAMGFPAGCTNRAGGIRNLGYKDDPFHVAPLATKQACEHRSFMLDCNRHGAWGCAMLGQSYRNGEGVPAQATRARAAFQASCDLAPEFAACAFSKRQLEQMSSPPTPGGENANSDDD